MKSQKVETGVLRWGNSSWKHGMFGQQWATLLYKRSTVFQGAEKEWKRKDRKQRGGKEEANKERKNVKKKVSLGNKVKKKG